MLLFWGPERKGEGVNTKRGVASWSLIAAGLYWEGFLKVNSPTLVWVHTEEIKISIWLERGSGFQLSARILFCFISLCQRVFSISDYFFQLLSSGYQTHQPATNHWNLLHPPSYLKSFPQWIVNPLQNFPVTQINEEALVLTLAALHRASPLRVSPNSANALPVPRLTSDATPIPPPAPPVPESTPSLPRVSRGWWWFWRKEGGPTERFLCLCPGENEANLVFLFNSFEYKMPFENNREHILC